MGVCLKQVSVMGLGKVYVAGSGGHANAVRLCVVLACTLVLLFCGVVFCL